MPATEVRTTWLELTDAAGIQPGRPPADPVRIERVMAPSPEFGRFLYTAVGGDWHWTDRLVWSRDRWTAHMAAPGFELWVASVAGDPAGYAELDARSLPDVEIAYFGVLAGYRGRGIGGWLLQHALRRGLALGRRVWLHTCSLDGPGALANYLARGLSPYREEVAMRELGAAPPGPWPGAHRPEDDDGSR